MVYPDRFAARAQDWMTAYLQVNPGLANRLLAEFDTNLQVREVRNRAFIPLNGLLSEEDMPALLEAGWVWRDYTSTADEMTRSLRGVLGTLASKNFRSSIARLPNRTGIPSARKKSLPSFVEK